VPGGYARSPVPGTVHATAFFNVPAVGRTRQKEYITSVNGTQVVDNYSRFELEALGNFCRPDVGTMRLLAASKKVGVNITHVYITEVGTMSLSDFPTNQELTTNRDRFT
jgi:hypothetical protein